MSVEFIGSIISVDCGEVLGTYQGQVVKVDPRTQSITLTKAFRNGVLYQVPQFTISACDIHDLKIIKSPAEAEKMPPVRQYISGPGNSPPCEPVGKMSPKSSPTQGKKDFAKTQPKNGKCLSLGKMCSNVLSQPQKVMNGSCHGSTHLTASTYGDKTMGRRQSPRNDASHCQKGQRYSPNDYESYSNGSYTQPAHCHSNQNNKAYGRKNNPGHSASRKSPPFSANNHADNNGNSLTVINGYGRHGGNHGNYSNCNGAVTSPTKQGKRVNSPRGGNGPHSPRGQRANQCAQGQRGQGQQRLTPNMVDDVQVRKRTNSMSDSQMVQIQGCAQSTPKKMENGRRRTPREDCFSAPVETFLDEEFDFEKNLAMFDKRAVFDQIENLGYPKIVRSNELKKEGKFKCDENVLQSKPAKMRQIHVPNPDNQHFVTDAGLVVPTVSSDLRKKLLNIAESYGLSQERKVEIVGRSASEMVLQLIGGSHRMDPQNAHQQPSAVVLCGPHNQGAAGINCARHLAMHNVHVTVFLPQCGEGLPQLDTELRLYDLTGCQRTSSIQDLLSTHVDIIVNAVESHENDLLYDMVWYQSLVTWSNQSKASVLAIDPPVEGSAISTKWSLSVGLPLPLSGRCGQVYLCDLSVPKQVYNQVGITYQSPFAHKFVIPLHAS